jgi:hypothetical protein
VEREVAGSANIKGLHPVQLIWIAANAVGMGIFLAMASSTWIEPELKDVPGASGGAPVVWALTALPVFAAFMLANLIWTGFGLAELVRLKRWMTCALALGTVVLWIGAFVFDAAHHGI